MHALTPRLELGGDRRWFRDVRETTAKPTVVVQLHPQMCTPLSQLPKAKAAKDRATIASSSCIFFFAAPRCAILLLNLSFARHGPTTGIGQVEVEATS